MGANGSSELDDFGIGRSKYGVSNLPPGKPSPPEGIPKVKDITHNSITLSWLSPVNSGKILAYQVESCSHKEKKWRIHTSTCQGTCYHIRNLTPETRFVFRVRAENICGQSKPSHISEQVTTRPVPEPSNFLEEKPTRKIVRRHSHYLKIDHGVNSLLSRTENKEEGNTDVGAIPFRRNNSLRGSLPSTLRSKRNSVTLMLPGSKREYACNYKDSKRSVEESSVTEEDGLNLKRISTSSTEASSIFSATSMTSIAEDEELKVMYEQTDCHMCSDYDDACSTTTSSQYSSSSSRSSHSSQCTHTSSVTHDNHLNFMSASNNARTDAYIDLRDRTDGLNCEENGNVSSFKPRAIHCHNNRNTNSFVGKTIFEICDNEIWKGRIDHDKNSNTDFQGNTNTGYRGNKNTQNSLDLRSIRQMLSSEDVMVKTLDSRNLNDFRRAPSVIKELDEECITVDIVSTI